MDHYVDIKVLPDPEFGESMLMASMFAKLHRSLVDVGQGAVGVSFPKAGKALGDVLRLHGTELALGRLMAENWLKGLRDYTESGGVQPVPGGVGHRVVRRVQVKSSAERLRRRSVKKGWLTEAAAQARILLAGEKRSKLPFIQLKSNSTGQAFRLFILQGAIQNTAVEGSFSDYGLSDTATTPYF